MANNTKKAVSATGTETPEELAAINQALEKEIEAQAKEIELLRQQVAEAAGSKRPVNTEPKTFKLAGKEYPFPAPKFRVPGFGVVTATEALKDQEILKKLVEIKAGSIE